MGIWELLARYMKKKLTQSVLLQSMMITKIEEYDLGKML